MLSLFKKFENKCKNKHKVQIKSSKIQPCTTDHASYSLTQWQFEQLTLKWLSEARAQDKNKQDFNCFNFFLFSFNYAIQGKFITWRGNSALNCTWKPISHESRSECIFICTYLPKFSCKKRTKWHFRDPRCKHFLPPDPRSSALEIILSCFHLKNLTLQLLKEIEIILQCDN